MTDATITERDMLPAITERLRRERFAVCRELMPGEAGYFCDVVGIRFFPRQGRSMPKFWGVVAVELKLRDAKDVLDQAIGNLAWANVSIAAMPRERVERMRKVTVDSFQFAGVILWSVDVSRSEITSPSCIHWHDIRREISRVRGYWWPLYRRAMSGKEGR